MILSKRQIQSGFKYITPDPVAYSSTGADLTKAEKDLELALDPRTSAVDLVALSKSRDVYTRFKVVQHRNTPVWLLGKMAADKNAEVRQAVARDPRTPPEALDFLATDKNTDVRCEVAANANAPISAIRLLMQDKNRRVRECIERWRSQQIPF